MTTHYPSWIEIPAADMERALRFYRAVFELSETPRYDEPPMLIAVLTPSEKSVEKPGVSLVQSPHHTPGPQGAQVNFHVGSYARFAAALELIPVYGGSLREPVVDMGDGVQYVTLNDCEGNIIALSAYEPTGADE